MMSYPVPCPHCDHVADSMDSMSDSRAELDAHLLSRHPDRPDPTHDTRWPSIGPGLFLGLCMVVPLLVAVLR